jgi:ribonuclease HI
MPGWQDDPDLRAAVEGELALLTPAVRGSVPDAKVLLHRDYSEIGQSGRSWDRDSVTAMMAALDAEPIAAEGLEAVRLGSDVILVTYTSVRSSGRRSCRSSIWVREGDRWLLRHHQGTPLDQQGR